MKWINANKKKPEAGKLVIVYTPDDVILDSNVLLGCYWDDTDNWTVYDFETFKTLRVTHWRSIPKEPLKYKTT